MPQAEENNGSARSPPSRSRRSQPLRLENVRVGINQMFTGRSRVGRTQRNTVQSISEYPPLQSPKTPRLILGLDNFSSTRLAIPYLNRTAPPSPIPGSPTTQHSPPIPTGPPVLPPNALPQQMEHMQRQQAISPPPSHVRQDPGRRFAAVDPAETHLAELAEAGRRRKSKSKRRRHFGLKGKSKEVRRKVISCIVSGLFLLLVLTIYLALALTNRSGSQEFHVVLILIILITTIFFCHGLIRLCMMAINPPATRHNRDPEQARLPAMAGVGGYANPPIPIRVALARDEEAAGIESEVTKYPPPAYGLWRESVRVDPNRIFWQRNEAGSRRQNTSNERPVTATRPPSYISEDGVGYVIEAAPRSFADPLPVHPSERGRLS